MPVSGYFGMLKAAMIESRLTDKSGRVYNVDELGLRSYRCFKNVKFLYQNKFEK
jgi:hypothetical protein